MTRAPIVELSDIAKGFPGVKALDGARLVLRPGEVHAVIGENGAGKSTLMNILAGELLPDAGVVCIDGHTVRIDSPRVARGHGIAVVFQELSLCANLNVGENVMLAELGGGSALGILNRGGAARAARSLLARLGLTEIDPATAVRDLTVAQMQLVEIARAISRKVRVLVLDEPNSALSPRESERLFDVVRGLREDGVAIVYVSHHLDEVLGLADRITILRDGRHVTTLDDLTGVTEAQLVSAMVGRDLDHAAQYALIAPAPQGVALRVQGLRVQGSGGGGQIGGIDFDLAPGEILGIAGLPDSGMDVLSDALFGLVPRGGTVTVAGTVVPPQAPARSIAAGLALIPADRRRGGALLAMTVSQNVISAALPRFARAGMLRAGLIRRTAADYAGQLDARLASLTQRMGTLSGGNQQKIILARGMVTQPRILILHEPTRGIDVGAKAEIYDILRRLAGEGMAILMISSELPEIVLQAGRVVVMRGGLIAADLRGADITEQNVMLAATGSRAKGLG